MRDSKEEYVQEAVESCASKKGEVERIDGYKKADKEQDIIIELLRLFNSNNQKHELMSFVIKLLKDWSQCDAVGIRLQEGEDFPYYETCGFSEDFVLAENYLCSKNELGQIERDRNGKPYLECMCGNIICSRFDPSKPFFTEHGSFWTNSTTELLAGTDETDRMARTRNRCNTAGYESVALIPLRTGKKTFGLLQFNDKEKGKFSLEKISLFERLADSFAMSLAHKQAEEVLQESEDKYRSLFENMPAGYVLFEVVVDNKDIPIDLIIISANEGFESTTDLKIKDILGKRLTKVLPGIENDAADWVGTYGKIAITGESQQFEQGSELLGHYYAITAYQVKPKQCAVAFLDITERKKAELELQTSRMQLYEALKLSKLGYWEYNVAERMFTFNDQFYNVYRTSADKIGGYKISPEQYAQLFLYPEDAQIFCDSILKVNEAKDLPNDLQGEHRVIFGDGEPGYVSINFFVIKDDKGNIVKTYGANQDITELKKAENEIRKERDLAEGLIETVQAIVLVLDTRGKIVRFNKFLEEISGYSLNEVQGKDWFKTFLPECDREQMRALFKAAINDIQTRGNINPIIAKSGDERQIEWYDKTLKDNAGKIIGLISIGPDITERLKNEQALKESKARLQLSLDAAELGIWDWDLINSEIVWDGHHAKLFGYEQDEFNGSYESFEKRIHPEDLSGLKEAIEKSQNNKEEYLYEYRVIWPDGTVRWILGKGRCIYNKEGQAIRMLGTVQDITETKQAEQEILNLKDFYSLILDNVHDGIWMTNEKDRMVYLNPGIENIAGIKSEDILGLSVIKDFPPETIEQFLKYYLKAKRTFKAQEYEANVLTPAGRATVQSGWLIPRVENGKYEGMICTIQDITERKKAEEALRKSEEKLNIILDSVPAMIWLKDVNGKYLWINKYHADSIGVQKEKAIGKTDFNIFPKEQAEKFRKDDKEILKTLIPKLAKEEQYKKSDGTTRWCRTNKLPYFDNKKELIGIIGFAIDITNRKQTEDALRESEELFRAFTEQAPEAIFVHDLEGHILISNKLASQYTGYSEDELLNMNVSEIDTAIVKQDHIKKYWEKMEVGENVQVETIHKRKNESTYPAEVDIVKIIFKNNPMLLCFIRDITERKRSQQALIESEAKYHSLIDNVPGVVWTSDEYGNTIFISSNIEQIYGYTPSKIYESESKLWFGRIHPDDVDQVKQAFKDVFEKRKSLNIEYRIRRKDDRWIWLWDRSIGAYDKEGIKYADGVFFDITERKQIEKALRENEQLLNEVGRIARIGGWEMDLITRKAKWTRGVYDIVEVGYDEPIPGPDEHMDYYLPEYRPVVEKAINDLIEKDIPLEFEAKAKTAKGNIKWFRAIGRAVRENDVCIKILGTLQDITEIKKAKEKIEELAKFPEENPDPVLRLSKEGIIIYGNKASKVILRTWNKKIGQRLPKVYLKLVRDALLSDEVLISEFTCENGQIFELIFTPIKEYGYVNIYGLDITKRKKNEKSILEYQEQLKSLASQLTLSEEQERHRIATNIHDHISQYLAVSKIKLQELHHLTDFQGNQKILQQVCDWLGLAIDETRSLTFDLSSPILYELGFEKAVEAWLEDEIQQRHGIETEFQSDGLPKLLDDDIRVFLFRDVRELLFNVIKHAHAKKVKVSVSAEDSIIKVIVEDDGVGFDPDEVTTTAAGKAKFGLFSIRERLELYRGRFEIDSAPGHGCRITLTAPLKE